MCVNLIGIRKIPLIKEGDDLANIIINIANKEGVEICNEDIIVIAETAIAKAEGTVIDLKLIKPSVDAIEISEKTGKNSKLVEAIIGESADIIKIGPDFIICETKHGFICANAGIDESNIEDGFATPIPINPDKSAEKIRKEIETQTKKEVAVIISDTQGRPFREGAVGVAIGISGMESVWDQKGKLDLYKRPLQTTKIAVADELASAASIIMGQADEGIPVVIIRGVNYFKLLRNKIANSKPLIRPKEYDVFR
ncbi:MAG: coenzyme F420-0:L-glutamate ligase [Methanobacterium sp.]|nr:coenzyme F420-0:L-glutamate ligase [Methanobacterium sp.]